MEITFLFHEVEFEISITLLISGHRSISEMVEVDILDTEIHAISEPTINESGPCLKRVSSFASEGN